MWRNLLIAAIVAFGSSNAMATVIFFDDFEGGSTALTGAGGITGAQGFNGVGGIAGSVYRNASTGNPAGATSLALGGIAAHSSMTISFDLLAIDSWDGDTRSGGLVPPDIFNLVVDAGTAFAETIDVFIESDGSISTSGQATRTSGVGSNLGFTGWQDLAYQVSITVAHVSSSATLDFFASGAGWQGGADESWGIDNLQVSVNAVAVPEPSTLALFGLGLIGLAFRLRRT